MRALERRLRGYRLTTAEITYHLPDYPSVLQKFIGQKLDLAPDYPELRAFLGFWQETLDGKVHSVRVASAFRAETPRVRWAHHVMTVHRAILDAPAPAQPYRWAESIVF